MSKPSYVYLITNDLDGRVYVGKSDNPQYRWEQHLKTALNPLYAAMASSGSNHFKMTVISETSSSDDAYALEKSTMEKLLRDGTTLLNQFELVDSEKSARGRTGKTKLHRSRVTRLLGQTKLIEFIQKTTESIPFDLSQVGASVRVYWSPVKSGFFGKYKDDDGNWRCKAIPRRICKTRAEAEGWFAIWLGMDRAAKKPILP